MKQRFIYYFLPMLTVLGMLASCSKEEMGVEQGDSPNAQSGEIRFEIGFAPQNGAMQTDAQTRVATDTKFNSTWEEGDEIGIFAVEHGKGLATSGNYIHNVKLTYTNGKWTAEEDIYWPKDGTKLDFYAYHPYAAEANNPTSMTFSVYTDQSESDGTKSNYNLSDVLMAKNDNSGNGYGKGETVPLSFTHALAMVQVNVSKSMIGDYPADMLKVWLNGCTTGGVLNLSTQSTTPPTNAASPVKIKMYPCPNDGGAPGIYAYRALVPVRTIAAGTVLFSFEYDGGTLLRSKPLVESLSLVQSKAEKFDMTFPFTSATVSADVRLAELFKGEELKTITHLKVMGEMMAADFKTIRDQMPAITSLDLGEATVVGNAIPNQALYNTPNLKEFVFPSGITVINSSAFEGCTGFTGSLTLPANLGIINSSAFKGCSGFTGLTLPASLGAINSSAFEGCTGFTGLLTLPANLGTIGLNAFKGCTGFTGSLSIPASVSWIGPSAFEGCTGFTGSLTLSANLGMIGSSTFKGCTGFTGSLTLPANLGMIGISAFEGCSGFNGSLTIPAGVKSIDHAAFFGCTGLTSIICHIEDPTKGAYHGEAFSMVNREILLSVPAGTEGSYRTNMPWSDFRNIWPIL